MRSPLFVLVLLVLAGAGAAYAHLGPDGAAPSWDERGPSGHATLVDRLAQVGDVRIVDASLGVLPRSAGDGDVLFLFPNYRQPTPGEHKRVHAFVQSGGLLVVAADGGHVHALTAVFGLKVQGIPALVTAELPDPCVATSIDSDGTSFPVCLPSPSGLPDLGREALYAEAIQVALSDQPIFLDANSDGVLDPFDIGPANMPVAIEWRYGRGSVLAIADADLWRNGAPSLAKNLEAAASLGARASGVIYVDSTGEQASAADRLLKPTYRAMAAPSAVATVALIAIGLAAIAWLISCPRAARLEIHDPPPDAVDETIQSAAQDVLSEFLAKSTERRSRPRQPGPVGDQASPTDTIPKPKE